MQVRVFLLEYFSS